MFTDDIRISESELHKVKEEIEGLLALKERVILSDNLDFRNLPTIHIDWNEHLLASIIKLNFSEYSITNTSYNFEDVKYILKRSS
jgi:hypothetical protein